MTGRSYIIELDDDQAQIVNEMAEQEGVTVQALLIDAIGHGLAMIRAGVDAVEDAPSEGVTGISLAQLRERHREEQEPSDFNALQAWENRTKLEDGIPL
jgi:septal ring-binding cell division protein DamX